MAQTWIEIDWFVDGEPKDISVKLNEDNTEAVYAVDEDGNEVNVNLRDVYEYIVDRGCI